MKKSDFFKDDIALDVLDEVLKSLRQKLEVGLYAKDCERAELRWIMAYFEVLYAVSIFCGNNEFNFSDVERWRDRALHIFDVDPRRDSGFVREWRRQIVESFNRLEGVACSP